MHKFQYRYRFKDTGKKTPGSRDTRTHKGTRTTQTPVKNTPGEPGHTYLYR